ncbi:MAG: ABC transporter permease [Chloroflexota bacterium]|nr:ABC transporter permease [Chloroflexota bacterium]
MSRRTRRWSEAMLTVSGPLVLLATWEWLSRTARIDPTFWPPPSSLWETFVSLIREGGLLGDVRVTLVRILGGFLLGAVPGVALGLAMGLFWPVRVLLMPIATAVYAVPKIAILPLVVIVFGLGESSKLAIVAISIFFLVVLNTMAGVQAIDPSYRDVARNLGANPLELFLTVALPGSLPAIFTGLRLALGFTLIVIVGTEFITPGDGVGSLIWESWQRLAIKPMFIGLVVTGLLGWLLTVLLDVVERWALPWQARE